MSNVSKTIVNRRTFKEVVTGKLAELCERLDVQINSHLARAKYYEGKGEEFAGVVRNFEAMANGLIDARHEAMMMAQDIAQGGEL